MTMKTKPFTKTFAAAAAFLVATAGAAGMTTALAKSPSIEQAAIEVRTDAVDFSSPTDVDSLHRQLIRAANRVCGVDGRLSARQVALRNQCVRGAVDQAVEVAAIAPLSVLHANLTPQDKYRSWRVAPDQRVMTMVAQAAGGMSRSAAETPPVR